jgi:hypothetical protein
VGAVDVEYRGVEGLYMDGFLHDYISYVGKEEAWYVLFFAIFGNPISASGVYACYKDSFKSV